MARIATDRLARSSQAELVAARRRATVLLATSHALAVASAHDPDAAPCSAAGCGLADVDPEGRLCALVHRLSGLAEDATPPTVPMELALPRFLAALARSFVAVRACRQTAHPGGHCWFTEVPGGDGCAEVLHLAHHLS